jgi:hypothetical protein
LYDDDDGAVRDRAETVLRAVTQREHGFVPGKGWPNEESREAWEAQWKALGNLNWKSTREERVKIIGLWKEWLRKPKAK